MHLAPFIRDLAVILSVAGLVSFIFRKIRQPVVLGYIIAGIIVGPYTPPYSLISDTQGIKIWAELGVIFLMFSLGLEFSFRKLASVGLSASFTACFEVIAMLGLGFATGKLIGWSSLDSLFLGAMLSISSTTIIIKALDELNFKRRRFAELIFAILIVEDLVAILILVALTNFAIHHSLSGVALLGSLYKLILVVGSWFLTGYFLVPKYIKHVGKTGNNETLTIVSLGLCLALVVFSTYFEYSAALGAFIMGSILAETIEAHRIEERMESLRDLFAAIFFVSVGMLINPLALWQHKGAVALITLVTVFGKTMSTTLGALFTGQPLKTSIQVGFGLAQIGEFSFIIAGLGMTLGVTSDFIYPVGVAVSLITTFTTPYMIRVSYKIAEILENKLPNRVKIALSHYANWTLKQQSDVAKSKEFYQRLFKWLINALIVSVIFLISGEFLLPFIQDMIENEFLAAILGWILTVAISAPFIWAMLSIFKNPISSSKRRLIPSVPLQSFDFVLQLLSLLWLGALSLEFLQAKYVTFIVGSLVLGLFAIFYKKIEPSYHWFENQFISTFQNKEKSQSPENIFRHLTPWDAHLVRLTVHPNAKLVALPLGETRLRTRYGVSIIAIQRGEKAWASPKPEDLLMPNDELLALGTDEQIDELRGEVENPSEPENLNNAITDYDMKQIFVAENSPLVNRTIRDSKLRENFGAMVVGIERLDTRIINPESDELLHLGDTLWVVGDKEGLEPLLKWNST